MNEELAQLVQLACNGNDNAFTKLMSTVKDRLYRIAYAHLQNEQDALEAIQETTYRAYKGIRKLREPNYFNTWIIRILLNYCMDELKRRTRMVIKQNLRSESISFNDGLITIRMEIDQLEPHLKQLIILKYLEDLTTAQIAELLGIPDSTIKTRLTKALTLLRKQMVKDGETYA